MLKAGVSFSSAFSARVWPLISPEKERARERGSRLLCVIVTAHLPMHSAHTNHAGPRSQHEAPENCSPWRTVLITSSRSVSSFFFTYSSPIGFKITSSRNVISGSFVVHQVG